MTGDCPSWCTGEHGFVDQHDGPGFGQDDRVCVLASAAFGSENSPQICVMLGSLSVRGSLHADLSPEAAADLLALLEDPAGIADTREALRDALASVSEVPA
jgi:hypothetical protein